MARGGDGTQIPRKSCGSVPFEKNGHPEAGARIHTSQTLTLEEDTQTRPLFSPCPEAIGTETFLKQLHPMKCEIRDALSSELTRTLRVHTVLADQHREGHFVLESAQREYDTALVMLVEHLIEHHCATATLFYVRL